MMIQEEKSLIATKNGFKKIIITNTNLIQPYQNENGILIIDLKNFLIK